MITAAQRAAYAAVKRALARGILARPHSCERCGTTDRRTSDGRTNIHAHHPDYSRPLFVEWLCAKCHRKETPLPDKPGAPSFGSKNGQARLTEDLVKEIRRSLLGCRRLAALYGVDKKTIQRARNGTHWNAAAPAKDKTP